MEIRYSYRDAPTIKRFSESDAFIRGLMGPFGSGKSSGCVIEIPKRGAKQAAGPDGIRRSRWAVIRNTYGQLRDTTEKTFLDWLPPQYFGHWRPSDHHYLINGIPGCEIEVLFRALDRPDHVRNLLSLELTGAWVNEAREIPWTIIEALGGRVGRYPARKDGGCSWYGIIMDTNPPDEDSRWYEFFEEMRPSNAAIFKQPSGKSAQAENLINLVDGYYGNLAIGKKPEWVKVYVDGNYGFVIDGKPVYGDDYDDNFHCREVQPIAGLPIYRGWDFGLSPACSLSQITPNGQWIVFDEIIATRMGAENFSSEVIAHCGQHYPGYAFTDIGDPAGDSASQTDEKTCFQILQAKGIKIEPGEQTLTIRIESVRKPLCTVISGKPGLVLSPRCKTLRKGFMGGYQYRRIQTSADKYTDLPDKNQYSHVHDGLQYVATRLFGGGLISQKNQPKLNYYELYA